MAQRHYLLVFLATTLIFGTARIGDAVDQGSKTYKQKQCLDQKCDGTCHTYTSAQDTCIPGVGEGGEVTGVVAKCLGDGFMTLLKYNAGDCTGRYTTFQTKLNQCYKDERGDGRYFDYICPGE